MGWLRRLLFGQGDCGATPASQTVVTNDLRSSRESVKAAGTVDGQYYTDHVEHVKQLKREKRYEEAIRLLLKLVEAIENQSKKAGWGVAPWYYEQLAIIYRKEKRFGDEVAILERYEAQPKAPGAGPSKLAERLKKARELNTHKP